MNIKSIFIYFFSLINLSVVAQIKTEHYTLQELKVIFNHKNYTDKVLTEFQSTMLNLREKPKINEEIKGEIISWFTLNGQYSINKTYLIKKNTIKEIKVLPSDDVFLKKINCYVPEKSKFTYHYDLWSFGYVTDKIDKKTYLIKSTVKSFNSYPEIPNDDILLYNLEYKTKDFKKFELIRLKDMHKNDWIEVLN